MTVDSKALVTLFLKDLLNESLDFFVSATEQLFLLVEVRAGRGMGF